MTIEDIVRTHPDCYIERLSCEIDDCRKPVRAWVINYGEGPHLCAAHAREVDAALAPTRKPDGPHRTITEIIADGIAKAISIGYESRLINGEGPAQDQNGKR